MRVHATSLERFRVAVVRHRRLKWDEIKLEAGGGEIEFPLSTRLGERETKRKVRNDRL